MKTSATVYEIFNKKEKKTEVPKCQMLAANIFKAIYTHRNKLGNTCNNVTTNFGLYISFFVKPMNNVFYNVPESVVSKFVLLCENG